MDPIVAKAALPVAKAAVKLLLSAKPSRKDRWRGTYTATKNGKYWIVTNDPADPSRLYVKHVGLEYAFAGTIRSDGGSIPKALQGVKGMRLKPDSFPRTFFQHDANYDTGTVFVRIPGGEWVEVPIDRQTADALLYIGLCAEDATLAEAHAIYRPVRMFGWRNWDACRKAERQA